MTSIITLKVIRYPDPSSHVEMGNTNSQIHRGGYDDH